jgi:hypothetical protein
MPAPAGTQTPGRPLIRFKPDHGISLQRERQAQPNWVSRAHTTLRPPSARTCTADRLNWRHAAVALPFPRSFQRGSSSGLKITPRFASAPRKAYSSRRNDVDPYKVLRNDWIKPSTRYQKPGSGTRAIPFGPTTLQRSPRVQQPHLAVNSGGHRDWTRRTNLASNE